MELSFRNPKFENEIRNQLNIFDRAITDNDALLITELDLTCFCMENEDLDLLIYFKNLTDLSLETGNKNILFGNSFPKLESLLWITGRSSVDFSIFSGMKNLTDLTVSGGDYSNITFENLDALISLQKLRELELHEFGASDFAPLKEMKQLKFLSVCYSDKVKNIEAIGAMTHLEKLTLVGLTVEHLDFLDTLPDHIKMEMCDIQISSPETVDVKKWNRVPNRDIGEIKIKVNGLWESLDLSELCR